MMTPHPTLTPSALAGMEENGPEYLIWSNEHRAWWRPNNAGYTTHVDAAGRYTAAQAINIGAHARDGWCAREIPSEIPVRLADVTECVTRARARALAAQQGERG
jgi:hypothetical protein